MPFLDEPAASPGQQALYDANVRDDGFVWDLSRQWGHQPDLWGKLVEIIGAAAAAAGLSDRDKAMLVLGTSTARGDSYCSVAWSRNLTKFADAATALAVLQGDDEPLTDRERTLVNWARTIASDPNSTTLGDIEHLREAGFDDPQILALTLFGALRMALSTTNDALGARPDVALAELLDPAVREAITWGRAPA